jgi:hypothetical protein
MCKAYVSVVIKTTLLLPTESSLWEGREMYRGFPTGVHEIKVTNLGNTRRDKIPKANAYHEVR